MEFIQHDKVFLYREQMCSRLSGEITPQTLAEAIADLEYGLNYDAVYEDLIGIERSMKLVNDAFAVQADGGDLFEDVIFDGMPEERRTVCLESLHSILAVEETTEEDIRLFAAADMEEKKQIVLQDLQRHTEKLMELTEQNNALLLNPYGSTAMCSEEELLLNGAAIYLNSRLSESREKLPPEFFGISIGAAHIFDTEGALLQNSSDFRNEMRAVLLRLLKNVCMAAAAALLVVIYSTTAVSFITLIISLAKAGAALTSILKNITLLIFCVLALWQGLEWLYNFSKEGIRAAMEAYELWRSGNTENISNEHSEAYEPADYDQFDDEDWAYNTALS